MLYITVASLVTVALVLWAVSSVNRLVRLKHEVSNAWGQVNVHLQRRHDLVPGLVESVRGYASHEKGIVEHLADAYSRALATGLPISESVSRENTLSSALLAFRTIALTYPELKANVEFAKLSEALRDVEEFLLASRQNYNDAVYRLKVTADMFPTRAFVRIAGVVETSPYFESDLGTETSPKFALT